MIFNQIYVGDSFSFNTRKITDSDYTFDNAKR